MLVPSPMLFAVETFPLLIYIFMALVVLSVPAFYVWEKVIQPKIDAKRKAEEEALEAAEAAADDEEPIGAEEGEIATGAEPMGFEGIELPEGAEAAEAAEVAVGAEIAGGAEVAVEGGEEPQEEIAGPADVGEIGEVAFEESLSEEMFIEEDGEKPSA